MKKLKVYFETREYGWYIGVSIDGILYFEQWPKTITEMVQALEGAAACICEHQFK